MPSTRNPRLDALRGIAALLVVVFHFLAADVDAHAALQWLWERGGSLPDLAYHGVQLFFMLSGFLITGILIRARRQSEDGKDRIRAWRTFEMRRALRILPLYYAVLFGTAALVAVGFSDADWLSDAMPFLLTYRGHVAAYSAVPMGWLGHFWTLGIEEYFYLLWPFIVLGAPWRLVGPSILAVLAVAWMYRTGYTWISPDGWTIDQVGWKTWQIGESGTQAFYSARGFLPQTFMLAAGGMLAWVMEERPKRGGALQAAATAIAQRVWLLAPACLLLVWIWIRFRSAIYDLPVAGFGGWDALPLQKNVMVISEVLAYGGAILVAAQPVGAVLSGVLERRWLCWVGRISYGVYVFHPLFLNGLFGAWHGWAELSLPLRLVTFLGATLMTAELSWRYFEAPLHRLRDKTFPTEHRAATSPPMP